MKASGTIPPLHTALLICFSYLQNINYFYFRYGELFKLSVQHVTNFKAEFYTVSRNTGCGDCLSVWSTSSSYFWYEGLNFSHVLLASIITPFRSHTLAVLESLLGQKSIPQLNHPPHLLRFSISPFNLLATDFFFNFSTSYI